MNRKRSKRLTPIVKLTADKEQAELTRLAHLQQNLQACENKLQQLLVFKQDYQSRYATAERAPTQIISLQNYQVFLQQLDIAIDQQRSLIQQHQQAVQLQRKHYLQAKQKASAMSQLQDRIQQQIQVMESKSEQKTLDESNQRRR